MAGKKKKEKKRKALRNPGVTATNPEVLWGLLQGELLKVLWISPLLRLGPLAVVLKDFLKVRHLVR